MQTQTTERTCEERVEQHMASRLEELRLMLNPTEDDAVYGRSDEFSIAIGDEYEYFPGSSHSGETPAEIFNEYEDEIRDELRERFYEYALSFDVVHAENPGESYVRYQISTGGPGEEIRFFCGFNRIPYKVEFWFLDWFDGASRDCTHHLEIDLLIDALGFHDWLADDDDFWSDEA
jgi:hypothetical protein